MVCEIASSPSVVSAQALRPPIRHSILVLQLLLNSLRLLPVAFPCRRDPLFWRQSLDATACNVRRRVSCPSSGVLHEVVELVVARCSAVFVISGELSLARPVACVVSTVASVKPYSTVHVHFLYIFV